MPENGDRKFAVLAGKAAFELEKFQEEGKAKLIVGSLISRVLALLTEESNVHQAPAHSNCASRVRSGGKVINHITFFQKFISKQLLTS